MHAHWRALPCLRLIEAPIEPSQKGALPPRAVPSLFPHLHNGSVSSAAKMPGSFASVR